MEHTFELLEIISHDEQPMCGIIAQVAKVRPDLFHKLGLALIPAAHMLKASFDAFERPHLLDGGAQLPGVHLLEARRREEGRVLHALPVAEGGLVVGPPVLHGVAPAVVQQHEAPDMVSGPVRLQAQRHVHVAHAPVALRILPLAVAIDVHLAADRPRLFIDDLAANGLYRLLLAPVPGQIRPREEVREGDLLAVEGHPEEGLVQLRHVLPDLRVSINRPLARLVGVLVGVREGVGLVKLRGVPRQKRHDEEALPHRCWEDINADLVAGAEDCMQLRKRIWVFCVLGVTNVHLVVSDRVEHPAKLRLEGSESTLDCILGVRQVSGDDQHVILKGMIVDGVYPVLVVLVIEVDVRQSEYPRSPFGPFQVQPKPGIEASARSGRLPEDQLLEACTSALLRAPGIFLHLHGPRKLRVCLLVQAVSQKRGTQLDPGVGNPWAGRHRLPSVSHCKSPIAETREGG
mmetsp:Transcript_40200/g.108601  ORF Transcript_40200/g.108601 Transcript_40200/m.108601 type:complete len:460 (-) Transcript_40200:109-1488(-)